MSNTATYQVRLGDWITEGWRMFTEQWKAWVLMTLIFFAIVAMPFLLLALALVAGILASAGPRGPEPALILLMYAGFVGLALLMLPVQVYLMGGMYRAAFKQMRGGQIEVRDLFSAGDCYWKLLGAGIMVAALVFVGLLLCVIPAYIAMGLLFFSTPLIVERGLSPVAALQTSKDLTRQNVLMFTLFAFVTSLIASVGSYACYIGLLATFPLQFTITAVAYRDCFGVEGAKSFSAGPAPAADYGAPPPAAPGAWNNTGGCRHCGAALPATGDFCPGCGNPVSR